MAFFANASNLTILGGSFVNNEGILTLNDRSQHTTNINSNNKSTNNVVNSHNDNSTRTSGSNEELSSLPSRSAGYREEDRTRPPPQLPPQLPRFSPPQITPTGGGTTTNQDSFNSEYTSVNNAFNNNSRNYYRGGAPPDDRRQNNGPNGISGPDQGLPSTSGLHGSGQFQPPVQVPFQASFPHQMGVVSPPGSHMSLNGGNIQQMDQNMGQNFENLLKSTISQVQSMAAGMSGGNSVPQSANSSSSRNVEGSDSMNTGMASLSLTDSQPQIPTHRSPHTSFSSDSQIGSNLTDQMGSLNPSTSSLNPFSNAVHHGSHLNLSLTPLMNEPVMGNVLSLPTETRPYGNNPYSSPPPASTSSFNLSPSFTSVSPNSNVHKHDRSVHQTNIDSFNERDNTIRESYNDNSLVDSRGNHSSIKSNKKRGFADPNVPTNTRKNMSNRLKTSPDPSNLMDEELTAEETDEQNPTAVGSAVDSSRKKKKNKLFPFFGRKS